MNREAHAVCAEAAPWPARRGWPCLRASAAASLCEMKTASVQELPDQWPQILRWVAAGEEVGVTRRKKTVAKIVPVIRRRRKLDWASTWAKVDEIFGGKPAPGKPASKIIIEGRR